MIKITPRISINDSELLFKYIRSSGPGGQNINKVSTAAQLRFNVMNSSLPAELKNRLLKIAARRINAAGEIIIEARSHRSQERNRSDAVNRFIQLVQKALQRPKARRKTRPTAASMVKRIGNKKRRGELKRSRQKPGIE